MSKPSKGHEAPSNEEIAAYAFSIYEQEGCPDGKHHEHWLQAEAYLIADRKALASQPAPKATAKAAPATEPSKNKSKNTAWQTNSSAQPSASRTNPN
jgi:hypothetical protein